jgi:alpha-L-fucosidase
MRIHTILAATLFTAGTLVAENVAPAPPEAVENWRNARFGMFIHWGPVSLTGHEIGWSRGAQTPIEEYDNLYKKFNPTKFDADEWVAIAKAAGMKYMVLTTKHHDGFCLWDTKETDYNIMNTPFGRDVVRELAEACKRGGIRFGAYYSTCDWHHPAFPVGSPAGSTQKPNPDMKAYDAYLQAQVTELITNYGPLFTLWFDVPQMYDETYGIPMVKNLRELQPDLMINNRAYSVGGVGSGIGPQLRIGDYNTPEKLIGAFNIDRPWESCMTICEQWAWKPDDRMKSLEECLHTLIRTNGGDGNLLFNVGPMPTGEIEPRQVERLKEMGEWLAINGDAIYGTRGGPWMPANHLVSTRKDDKIYVHLLKKSASPVQLSAPDMAIRSARLLNGPAVRTETRDGILSLEVPDDAWDPISTIIELTVAGSAMDIEPLDAASGFSIPGTKASASGIYQNDPTYDASKAIDGDPGSRWATDEGTKACWIQLDLPGEYILDSIEIDEAYTEPAGRVREFEILARQADAWTTVHTGNGLGANFKTTFDPVTTRSIRINILDASDGPTLSEIRLPTAKAKP